MTKATFTGYFPKLKAHREATVKSGKAINPKGSIRYQIKGECMDDEKGLCVSLPKMVTREDFENVYGFDAKEAEGVLIYGTGGDGSEFRYHEVGREEKDGFTPETIEGVHPNGSYERVSSNQKNYVEADTVGSPSPADVEPPAPSEKPFPQEPSNENFSADNEAYYQEFELRDELEMYDAGDLNDMIEELVIADGSEKEWLESYGYEDWSEANLSKKDAINAIVVLKMKNFSAESEMERYSKHMDEILEVKARLLQENEDGEMYIDDPDQEAENDAIYEVLSKYYPEEYDAETFEAFGLFGDKDEEEAEPEEPKTQEFTVVLQEGDKLELTDVEETADTKDEDEGADEENEEKASDCDDHFYEAVQAKVTRPVKEEEEKEEVKDDEEGSVDLGTIATVGAVGLATLAIGSMLAAEDEGELDYWDGENAEWRAEGEGEVDFGTQTPKRQIDAWIRHDHNWADYNWRTDGDLSEDETYTVKELVEETIVEDDDEDKDEGPYESTFTYNDDSGKDRDVDIEWHKWRDDGRYYGRAAEGEDFQKMTPSEFVPFDQMQEELGQMWDETTAPLANAHNYDYEPSNEPSNANFSAEGWVLTSPRMGRSGVFTTKDDAEKVKAWHEKHGNVKGVEIVGANANDGKLDNRSKQILLGSETVGSPSPSGPSSIPEPAEATGSEPSNEHMEADSKTKNIVIGLTLGGIGISTWLGKDTINKWFDRFGL